MVGIGLMCVLFIVLMYEGIKFIIVKNKVVVLEQVIFKVLFGIVIIVGYYWNGNVFMFFKGIEVEGQCVYVGFSESGILIGLVLFVVGLGYVGEICVLYGYDFVQEVIVGFYVLESKEMFGLGDKIEKDFVFKVNFEAFLVVVGMDGNSLKNKIVYVKSGEKQNVWEVDGIIGVIIFLKVVIEVLSMSIDEWVFRFYGVEG